MKEKTKIKETVERMFKINLGTRPSEKILVVTDTPTVGEWTRYPSDKLDEMVNRSVFAKFVSEIAGEKFDDCIVEFYPYSSVGQSGRNPGKNVGEKMLTADIIVAITTYSLSHTQARNEASKGGSRIASMPNSTLDMFYPGGPMSADYEIIAEETQVLANWLTGAKTARVTSKTGTDLTFSLANRKGGSDNGLYTEKGRWGNLPAGEAYIAPLEKTATGILIVEKGWYPKLTENLEISFQKGNAYKIISGGSIGEKFEEMLFKKEGDPYISRRNLAELGIGTNPNAKRPDNPLEAEKIKGTVHIGIGNSLFIGGLISSDLHIDFIIPQPDLILDGNTVIKEGQWLIEDR